MTATNTVSFRLTGADDAHALLDELSQLLAEFAERFPQMAHRLVDFFDRAGELFCINPDGGAAAAANEVVMRLDPSDGLLRLLAALRAGDDGLGAVEHSNLSKGLRVNNHTLAERAGGVESPALPSRVTA